MGRTLVDQVERPDVAALRLKDVLTYDTKQAISFFVGLEILKNEKPCDICGAAMLTEKRKERVDGIQWRCLRNKKLCSRKSIRFGTFFARSQLPLETWLLIFYMWANDYSNKQIVKETGLHAPTMCDWLNFCREVCQNYCHNQRMLGGDGRYVEIDEASICRRKYNRGRSRVGASQWVFGGVERRTGEVPESPQPMRGSSQPVEYTI